MYKHFDVLLQSSVQFCGVFVAVSHGLCEYFLHLTVPTIILGRKGRLSSRLHPSLHVVE